MDEGTTTVAIGLWWVFEITLYEYGGECRAHILCLAPLCKISWICEGDSPDMWKSSVASFLWQLSSAFADGPKSRRIRK